MNRLPPPGRDAAHLREQPTSTGMVARGRVHVWPGGSLWIGRGGGRARWHAHHAHQISLPFEGTVLFRSEAHAAWTEYRGAFVASDRPHELELADIEIGQLFVEPETPEGRALGGRFEGSAIAALPEPERTQMTALLRGAHSARVDDAAMVRAARAAIALLSADARTDRDLDPRIAQGVAHIREHIRGPIGLAGAAAAAALSPGRFRHLFVQETGVAFRSYVLWLRLNVAIEHSMAGGTWTGAAHEAGFADSAHLSRTFKRMFGMNPATLIAERRSAAQSSR